jgi:hypothetical protein
MTIDERIEALTQTVELLAGMHKDHEKRMVEALAAMNRRNERLETLVAEIGEAMTQIIPIVRDHELRIRELEGSPSRQ